MLTVKKKLRVNELAQKK